MSMLQLASVHLLSPAGGLIAAACPAITLCCWCNLDYNQPEKPTQKVPSSNDNLVTNCMPADLHDATHIHP